MHLITVSSSSAFSAPTKLRSTALSFTSAMFNWAEPVFCSTQIDIYIIQVSVNHSYEIFLNTTSFATTINVFNLSRGVEYKIFVFGKNMNGNDGDKAMVLLTLDGMYVQIIILLYSTCIIVLLVTCSS